jgi:hypothetical protein
MRLVQVFYPVKLPLVAEVVWGPYKKSELLDCACDEIDNNDMWALQWNHAMIWSVIEIEGDTHSVDVEAAGIIDVLVIL